jgi:hypothetical protein
MPPSSGQVNTGQEKEGGQQGIHPQAHWWTEPGQDQRNEVEHRTSPILAVNALDSLHIHILTQQATTMCGMVPEHITSSLIAQPELNSKYVRVASLSHPTLTYVFGFQKS